MSNRDLIATFSDWLAGILLIAIGLFHWLAGGADVASWLRSAAPAMTRQQLIEGRLGFEMGGHLAVAIGLSFIVLGRKLPPSYYGFWAVVFLVITVISGWSFGHWHVSQLSVLVTFILGLSAFGRRRSFRSS